ncbi:MAG: TrkA C-terminal domain-containing protein [Nitriliruptor sp.]
MLGEQPLLAIFLVLAVGTVLGSVRIAGTAIGPAGALFAGLAISAAAPPVSAAVPPLIGTLGLALFVYTVGLAGGPTFFGGLRRGAPAIAATVATYVVVALVAWGLGAALGLSPADVAGTYAGAGTNTSGLAAVVDVVGDPSPAVGYSLSYPFGVIGMLLAVGIALRRAERRPAAEDAATDGAPTYTTIVIARAGLPSVAELTQFGGSTLVFSRVRRDGLEHTPLPEERFEPGDLVTVIGTPSSLAAFRDHVGVATDEDLVLDRRQLDFRRVVLSNPEHAGSRISELELERFGATAGFVRRGDVDVIAHDDLVVELGDRIRVIAPRDRMPEVLAELGDSERAVVVADPVGFSLGLLLGLLVGLITIPLPGRSLVLGAAAGPLVVGLVLGRLGRSGPVVWQLPYATNQTLRQLGALLFLAVIGLGAGQDLAAAITSTRGLLLLGLGAVLTSIGAIGVLAAARLLGAGGPRTAGMLAGAQGQPAVLASALDRTGGDDRVALTYALLFPPAFLTKIVVAQVLATL